MFINFFFFFFCNIFILPSNKAILKFNIVFSYFNSIQKGLYLLLMSSIRNVTIGDHNCYFSILQCVWS